MPDDKTIRLRSCETGVDVASGPRSSGGVRAWAFSRDVGGGEGGPARNPNMGVGSAVRCNKNMFRVILVSLCLPVFRSRYIKFYLHLELHNVFIYYTNTFPS